MSERTRGVRTPYKTPTDATLRTSAPTPDQRSCLRSNPRSGIDTSPRTSAGTSRTARPTYGNQRPTWPHSSCRGPDDHGHPEHDGSPGEHGLRPQRRSRRTQRIYHPSVDCPSVEREPEPEQGRGKAEGENPGPGNPSPHVQERRNHDDGYRQQVSGTPSPGVRHDASRHLEQDLRT